MQIRTDLALEAHQLWQQSAQTTTTLPGVRAVTRQQHGFTLTVVEILDDEGQAALGKPPGRYVTLELQPKRLNERSYARRAEICLSEQLRKLLRLEPEQSILVVGLGNSAVTPDAVGPRAVSLMTVTRHLPSSGLRQVCAIAPGVLGTTGLESLEVVRGIVERVQPSRVLVLDALVSREPGRIGSTVQLADTGIVPGSGIGNHRVAFNEASLGVPVIAVGVPTVVEARTLCHDLLCSCGANPEAAAELLPGVNWVVTPQDMDTIIDRAAELLGRSIDLALLG